MRDSTEMTLIATITGDQYRGAMQCVAKGDNRFYLEGLYIRCTAQHQDCPSHADLVATNGHIMLITPIKITAQVDTGFNFIMRPVGIKANVAEIRVYGHLNFWEPGVLATEFDEKLMGESPALLVKTTLKNGTEGPQFWSEIIKARYPDYEVVVPLKKNRKPYDRIGFDSAYLETVAKVFRKSNIEITTHCEGYAPKSGRPGATIIRPVDGKRTQTVEQMPADTRIVLMPILLKD